MLEHHTFGIFVAIALISVVFYYVYLVMKIHKDPPHDYHSFWKSRDDTWNGEYDWCDTQEQPVVETTVIGDNTVVINNTINVEIPKEDDCVKEEETEEGSSERAQLE